MPDSINWQLQSRRLSELKPLEINPRSISKEQFQHLQTSIAKFGFIDKPIITRQNQIVCGHQRVKVLKKMKVKECECWVPDRDLDEKEIRELCLRHNLNTGFWDWDELANNFEIPDLIEYGFNQEQLFNEFEEKESKVKKAKKTVICPSCQEEFNP